MKALANIFHFTPKALRLSDLRESGKSWEEAEAIVDREFTEDGTSLRPEAADSMQPVHLACVETCTDEEFGGYFIDTKAALAVASKHPHACQILPVSIEQYRENALHP